MAVTTENTKKQYRGLSTDVKPGLRADAIGQAIEQPPEGATFIAIDTGERHIYHAKEWVPQPQTLEALLGTMIDLQTEILAVVKATHRGHEEFTWEGEVPFGE